jgi:hypothetical protein
MMLMPAGISYEDSYVLKIVVEPYSLRVAMDFVLTRQHARYRDPVAGERDCFLRGEIRVDGFHRIAWLATGTKPSIDSSGEVDYGKLDEISVVDGELKLSGDWGAIEVAGGDLTVSFPTGMGSDSLPDRT